ncbi:DNA repair protein RecO, partial [Candidatus Uhrbacteria bacterium]|nr:DNA repair protein RecO [Candidatus Uhrbacteria bacterium]MBD3284196.1 DNA repair protein RecO [Candidatus Uhrbacteria bacterium]
MSYLRDRAVILKAEPFREHDRRLVLFGRSHGLLEAVARGASRKESKQSGHLVPFMEVEVMIAKGSAFDKLAVARVVDSHRRIRQRLGALTYTGAFFDLFERLQKPGIEDTELYHLLQEVLFVCDQLSEDPSIERTKLLLSASTLKLLDRIGYSPNLTRCALCHDTLEETEHRLLPGDGSIVHIDCYRSIRASQPHVEGVSNKTLALVRFLRTEPLMNVLYLTGTSLDFADASNVISYTLKQTPLTREPHGIQ